MVRSMSIKSQDSATPEQRPHAATIPLPLPLPLSLSEGDLRRLADLVADRLRANVPVPTLLTKDELAAQIKVGPATIARCVTAGMPCVYVGPLPRFDPAACRAWLMEHGRKAGRGKGSKASEENVSMVGVRRIGRGR